MVTGEIKNRIDSIWDTFWTDGITNPVFKDGAWHNPDTDRDTMGCGRKSPRQ